MGDHGFPLIRAADARKLIARAVTEAGFVFKARKLLIAALAALTYLQLMPQSTFAANNAAAPDQDSTTYGEHYSSLAQINRSNVAELKQAWSFDTGEHGRFGTYENTPLIVGGKLFAATPSEKIVALDAATGKLQWTFDPHLKATQPIRGFTFFQDGDHGRIFVGITNFLFALDTETGKPIATFGDKGHLDLRENLDTNPARVSLVMTTPGVIYKDLIIVGFRAPETNPAPHGDIRAFDVRTGKLRWVFHTIPHPGEPGYATWPPDAWKTAGAANNWAGMVVDQARGIVYAPTGSAVDDFYGADRIGDDLFADTLLALDANTGKRIWHFQGVHHDIWDRDFPSAPALLTVNHNGRRVDALAQTTKQGYLYLFDRASGKPLFPIEEMPVPQTTIPGEVSSRTQPHPLIPEPFAPQTMTIHDLTPRPETHVWAVEAFKKLRGGTSQFTPLALDVQTITMPGCDGGGEWGGPAVDPRTGILYVNANVIPYLLSLVENKQTHSAGAAVYQSQCAVCHGDTREGSPPVFPSLVGVSSRLTDTQIGDTVHAGRGRMPSFPNIQGDNLQSLLDFLRSGVDTVPAASATAASRATEKKELASIGTTKERYHFTGYTRFVDPDGYPANSTPWGTLSAIDMNTGKYLWKIPLGEYPELAAKGLRNTGTENYGGPIVTAGGVLFIASTIFDRQFHAFDSATGKLLWHTELPYGGLATPATYSVNGKQFVVIAAGGGKDPKHGTGGVIMAYALP